MAKPKKGTIFQTLVPMVDRTDFATIESGITESDFGSAATRKVWGYNQQGSTAAASATISKTVRLVRSGIFQVTLNATETNFDKVLIWLSHPSCALQLIEQEFVDFDDSDLMSRLSDVASDLRSLAVAMSSLDSDLYSQLSDFRSDLNSLLTTTGVQLNASMLSDLRSAIAAGPAATVTASDISDIASAVWANAIGTRVDSRILVIQSSVSAVSALISDAHSDLRSFLVALSAEVSNVESALDSQFALSPDASDVASAVAAELASEFSDVRSMLTYLSGALSDLSSQVSDFRSDLHSHVSTTGVGLNPSTISDLRSAIAAVTATIDASAASDIASAVWAHTIGARVDSRVLLTQSQASDAASAAQQGASRALLLISTLSDVASQLTLVQSMASDAASAAQQGNSRALLLISTLSDVASAIALVKAQTDRLPSAVVKNAELANFEFLMVQSSDHATPATGLGVTATRSIDGAAFGACANAVTEVASGIYKITLAAADLNGDVITVRFAAAAADDAFYTFITKPNA